MAVASRPPRQLLFSGKFTNRMIEIRHHDARTQGSYFQDSSVCPGDSPDVGRLRYGFRAQTYRLSPEHGMTVSLAMEAIGDITASAEVSQLPVDGEEFDTRIQGGILVSNLGLTC